MSAEEQRLPVKSISPGGGESRRSHEGWERGRPLLSVV
jgi:hypothetical protein